MRYEVKPLTYEYPCQLKWNGELFYIFAHITKNKLRRCFSRQQVGNVTGKQRFLS